MWQVILGVRHGESETGKGGKPTEGCVIKLASVGSGAQLRRKCPSNLQQADRTVYPLAPPPAGGGLPQGNELLPPIAGLGSPEDPQDTCSVAEPWAGTGEAVSGVVSTAAAAGSRMAQGKWDRHQKPPCRTPEGNSVLLILVFLASA